MQPDEEARKTTLFLSYGRRDAKDLADRLCVDLAAAGYEVWRDTREIVTGASWQQEIVDGLRSAQVVIALLTPHSVRSGSTSTDGTDSVCLGEIAYALYNPPSRPVLPVMAAPCEAPLCIFHLDYTDLTAWQNSESQYQAGLQRLLKGIPNALRGEKRYRKWYHQLNPWDFSAFLYEKRRGFVGREWLFDEIDAWRSSHREPALLIKGDPGSGKSAVVAKLVHRNPLGQVIAYHCCQADTLETLQPWRFVRSIAAMIASRLPEYAAQLDNPDIQDILSTESCQRDAGSALERGVLTPLQALHAPAEGVAYILIDALDEALTIQGESNTIVRLLSTRLGRLPPWLRIVATTRNEPDVLERLSHLRAKELSAEDPRNLEDIHRYTAARLQSPNLAPQLVQSGASAQAVSDALLDKSEGNFLYVRQTLDAVERDQYSFNRLNELPQGLNGLYLDYFERRFSNEAQFQSVRRLLEVLVAAAEPLSCDSLVTVGEWNPRELAGNLRQLSTFIRSRTASDGKELVTLYHKSLADWLTDPSRTGNLYSIDAIAGHRQLSDAGLRLFATTPDALSFYHLAYLSAHLIAAERWDDLEIILTDLRFIEAKCTAGQTFSLVREYNAALTALPELAANRNRERLQIAALQQYGRNLIAFSRAPECVSLPEPPQTQLVIARFRQSLEIVEQPDQLGETRPARILAFGNFVKTKSHVLSQYPQETLVLARNYSDTGSVSDCANSFIDAMDRPWLARSPRPPVQPERPLSQQTLQGHTDFVYSVAITSDGRRAISASTDRTLRVWDLDTGAEEQTLWGHTGNVNCVAITPDGCCAVSAGEDLTLRMWDLTTGAQERTLLGHKDRVFSVALTADGRRAVSASRDQTVRVWDLTTGLEERILQGHTDRVMSVALTPDGRRAVSGSNDCTLRVWDLETGAEEQTLRGHASSVNSVAITPDGCRAISASTDRTLRVWNLKTGDTEQTLQAHTNRVNCVVLTPDGRRAISASDDRTLRVWDLETMAEERLVQGHTQGVSSMAITPDGRRAVSASLDRTLRVWDLETGTEERPLDGHVGAVNTVAITPDSCRAVSAGRDNILHVWDLTKGAREQTLHGHAGNVNYLAITPDSRLAVSASTDRTLRVWDLTSGTEQHTLRGHTNNVNCVAITSDGRRVISASTDRTLRVWDLDTGAEEWTLQGHIDRVSSVAITPDHYRAVSASTDRTLRVWDLVNGTVERTLLGHTGNVNTLALTPDGRCAVSGSTDCTLRVWDLETGSPEQTLGGHESNVNFVTITPDGRCAVSASDDRTVRVWDLERGIEERCFQGHKDRVLSVSITPDGRHAVSASRDHTIQVWYLDTGKCLSTYLANSTVSAIATRGLDRIVGGSIDGQLHFLSLCNFR